MCSVVLLPAEDSEVRGGVGKSAKILGVVIRRVITQTKHPGHKIKAVFLPIDIGQRKS